MNKSQLQTLKGFRDFLPQKMSIRNEAILRLRSVFERYGFQELQTPTLEYQDVLLGKYGEEAEKLMYLFEDQGKRKVGMKYDLTVPLARVVSSNPELQIPFKRYQIQPVWRADNPQKGRYREVYQCDVDTVGSNSPTADAEIIAVINDSLKILGFPNFKIKVNSRKVLFSVMEKSKIDKKLWLSIIQSIDKLDKKSQEEVEKEMSDKNLTNIQIKDIFNNLSKAKPDDFLQSTIDITKSLGVNKNVIFEPTLSRGLDYYTGPIFESVVEAPKIGSITGGGRYDELLKTLGGPDLPAVGTTIGLDRVCDVVEELNLWPNVRKSSSKVLVTVFTPELLEESIKVVTVLRQNEINAELYLDQNTKLEKQIKYADKKQIPYVIILGQDEIKNNVVTLKSLQSKEQKRVSMDEVCKLLCPVE